jgi:hypothetical protein
MLHSKILNARDKVKQTVKELRLVKLYAQANPVDKFVMVVHKVVLDEFMGIVCKMSGAELSEGDWWNKGFKKEQRISSASPEHSGLMDLSIEVSKEIYQELTA